MSSTDYQDDPWGRHWCHAPRRNGFLGDLPRRTPGGRFALLKQWLLALVRGKPAR